MFIQHILDIIVMFKVVDFLHPFYEESLGVLVKQLDSESEHMLSSVFLPFQLYVWLSIVLSGMVTGVCMYCFRYVISKKHRSHGSTVWYCLSSFLNQGEIHQ